MVLQNFRNAVKAGFSAFAGQVRSQAALNAFVRGREPDGQPMGSRVRNPYKESVWVYAAINAISTPIRRADLEFRNAAKGGDVIEDQQILQFWDHPAKGRHGVMDFGAFIDLFVALRGTDGVFAVLLDDSWIDFSNPMMKRPLRIVRLSQLQPIYRGRELEGFQFRNSYGELVPMLPEQVVFSKRISAEEPDGLTGVSPFHAARVHVESEVSAAKFAKRNMDRNGDQGQYILAKGPTPTKEQQEQLLAMVDEKRRAANRGQVKDVVLGGDISIESPTLAGVGSDFAAQQEIDAKTIWNAFGLPLSMMESTASYSIGSASDLYRALHNVIMPEAEELARLISLVSEYYSGRRSLVQEIRDGYRRPIEAPLHARFSFDEHPAMVERRDEQIERGSTLFEKGLPWEAIDEYLDLGLPEFVGKDRAYLPENLYPVEVMEENVPAETKSAPLAVDILDDTSRLVRQLAERKVAQRRAEEEKRASDRRAERWRRLDQARRGTRDRFKKAYGKQSMRARTEVLKKLKENLNEDGSFKRGEIRGQRRGVVLDLLFDLDGWKASFLSVMRAIGLDAFLEAMAAGFVEVGFELPEEDDTTVSQENPEVIKFLKERENFLRGIGDDIHRKILDELEEGLNAGETIDELADRVRSAFNGMDRARAETIAITETGAAYESARMAAFRRAGVKKKRWLSSQDDKVRHTHEAADAKYMGKAIGLEEFFEVGEAHLLYPVDTYTGADHPEETINCRCVLEAVINED